MSRINETLGNIPTQDRYAMRRAEAVLKKHGVPPDERTAYNQGDRPKKKIDAIIKDIRAAAAEDGE